MLVSVDDSEVVRFFSSCRMVCRGWSDEEASHFLMDFTKLPVIVADIVLIAPIVDLQISGPGFDHLIGFFHLLIETRDVHGANRLEVLG